MMTKYCVSGPAAAPLGLRRALGDDAEARFDAITRAVASIVGSEIALISFADGDTLWFKSTTGEPLEAIPIAHSYCQHVIADGALLVVRDTRTDPRFAGGPLITHQPSIRFYAGAPLVVRGQRVGSLCAIGSVPHDPDADRIAMLIGLAGVVEGLIEAKLSAVEARDDADRLAAALASRDRLFRQLQQAERMAELGSWRLSLADQSLEYSDQTYAIHDLPIGDAGGLADALSFYPLPDRDIIAAAVERAITTGQPYDLELDFITARGRLRRVRAMGEPELHDSRVVALVGVFQDVTDRHRLQQALERKANTDELTDVAGRRGFNAHLDAVARDALERRAPMALMLIDLDRFKEVNDRFGHGAGDDILRRTARILRAGWLGGSFAARLGGDEFALIVTEPALLADLDGTAARLAADLVMPVGDGAGAVTVSATIGVCRLDATHPDRRRLLEAADAALYRAKERQRGTVAFAPPRQPLRVA